MSNFPPVFIMLAGAAIVPIFPARVRAYAFLAAPVLVLVQLLLWLNDASSLEVRLAGISLNLLDVNDLNRVWATVFAFVALGGGIFALHVRQRIQQSAALAYAGCALGVVLAGDLITLITFWELASITSFFLIANGGRARSLAAAKRYIFVHIAGGSALLGGILWHAGDTGSFAITTFEGGAGWLALIGVLVNAAAFPLHAWLSDAYPESSPTGMVFLGAFTTKSAVYVLAVLFSGWGVLLIIGAFMALHGTIYALMQNDIRRIIAFHIISQVGIMVIAVGVGGNDALETTAHTAFEHIVWQGLMVMGMGAVLYATGTSKLTELGGLARSSLRWVLLLYMIPAISITFVPLLHDVHSLAPLLSPELFGADNTRLYLLESAFPINPFWIIAMVTIASAATVPALLIRLPYYAFFGAKRDIKLRPIPITMYLAMAVAGGLGLAINFYLAPLFDLFHIHIHVPEGFHVAPTVFMVQFMLLAVAGSSLTIYLLRPRDATVLDTDWFYRKAGAPVRILIQQPLESLFSFCERLVGAITQRVAIIASAPAAGRATVLSLSSYARRNGPGAAIAFLGRPPIGIAIAILFLTFAAILLAQALG